MADDRNLHDDFSYVRAVLDRAETGDNPAVIYFLWAAISFIGFAMIDFFPEKTGLYWMIAGPAGGLLSGFLGWRSGRALGQSSRREGRLHGLHWSGLMGAILLLIPLGVTHQLPEETIPRLILLLVAFGYFSAGLHLDRRLLWVGLALGGCYLFTVFEVGLPYLWTITAALLSASLVIAGLFALARARRAA